MLTKAKNRFSLAMQVLRTRDLNQPVLRDVPAITGEEVAEALSFFPLEKFFIFGHARSGTTLLTRLVRLHPQVHCNYQAHFFTRPPLLEALVANEDVGAWLARLSNRWNRGRDLSPVVLRAVSDYIMERDARHVGKAYPGCVVGDKSPNSLLNDQAVRQMVKVYPDARLVYILRDGRDAVLSHRFQAFIDKPEHLSKDDLRIRQDFINNPKRYLSGQRSIFTESGLSLAAKGWADNAAKTDQTGQELLGEQYHQLRYEDLMNHPWEEMSKLWTFLGVEPHGSGLNKALETELKQNPDAEWQQHKAADIAGSLEKGKRGTWRELFTPQDRQIFKDMAGEALIAWGYEKTPDW